MKSITFLMMLMILLTAFSLPAQTKDIYLLKSKHQKTAAWAMLGGGTTLIVVGGIIGVHGFFNFLTGQFEEANNNIGLAGILDITGGVAMLGSIPLFIASSKNKHKAMSIAFTSQQMPELVQHITSSAFIPSVSLKFHL